MHSIYLSLEFFCQNKSCTKELELWLFVLRVQLLGENLNAFFLFDRNVTCSLNCIALIILSLRFFGPSRTVTIVETSKANVSSILFTTVLQVSFSRRSIVVIRLDHTSIEKSTSARKKIIVICSTKIKIPSKDNSYYIRSIFIFEMILNYISDYFLMETWSIF